MVKRSSITTSTRSQTRKNKNGLTINLNPKKVINKTVGSLKALLKVGANMSRKTLKSTRYLLKSADKALSRL